MIFDSTEKSLQFVLTALTTTSPLQWWVSWADQNQLTFTFIPGSGDGNADGSGDVVLVPPPGVNLQRQLKDCAIYNADSVDATIIVQGNNAGSLRPVVRAILAPGEALAFQDGNGWYTLSAAGEVKESIAGVAVTSVAATVPSYMTVTGSPITGAGTLGFTFNDEPANFVFSGPASGPDAPPDFRLLVIGDIPDLSSLYLTSPAASALFVLKAGDTMTGGLDIAAGGTSFTQGVTGTNTTMMVQGDTAGATTIVCYRAQNSVGAPSAQSCRRSRGTILSPLILQTGDAVGNFTFGGYNSAVYSNIASLAATLIDPAPGTGSMAGQFTFMVTPVGSTTPAEQMRMEAATGWSAFGANVFLNPARVVFPQALAPGTQRIAPATGFSQTIANNTDTLLIHSAGTLATGTITMPATPVINQVVNVVVDFTITTLTLSPNAGQTLAGTTPTTISADTPLKYKWSATDSKWFKSF